MDNHEQTVRPGTNETDRRDFGLTCLVGALVGASSGPSDDILSAYDVGNPANTDNTEIPAGSLTAIIGRRTIGGTVQNLGAGEQLTIRISARSQFNHNVEDEITVTADDPCFVSKYAYNGKPTIRLEAETEITSGAELFLCSVGFGLPVPYNATTDLQIVHFDHSGATGGPPAVDAATVDAVYSTFVPAGAPAVGDSYYVYGCSTSLRTQPSGTVISDPVASF